MRVGHRRNASELRDTVGWERVLACRHRGRDGPDPRPVAEALFSGVIMESNRGARTQKGWGDHRGPTSRERFPIR